MIGFFRYTRTSDNNNIQRRVNNSPVVEGSEGLSYQPLDATTLHRGARCFFPHNHTQPVTGTTIKNSQQQEFRPADPQLATFKNGIKLIALVQPVSACKFLASHSFGQLVVKGWQVLLSDS